MTETLEHKSVNLILVQLLLQQLDYLSLQNGSHNQGLNDSGQPRRH